MYMCMNMVHIIHSVRTGVMEAENSIALTMYSIVNVFIALGWHS